MCPFSKKDSILCSLFFRKAFCYDKDRNNGQNKELERSMSYMSKKVDARLPKEVGTGLYPVKSPWDKMITYHEAARYCQRYTAAVSAAIMQAYRMLVKDYEARSKAICKNAYNRLAYVYQAIPGYTEMNADQLRMHPFMRGNFVGGLIGDAGDEDLLMCGRVNDFGTYRAEKELDVCYWDIIGSELCRSTTQSLQACADYAAKLRPEGPHIEYHMVEAKGCGDRHCRIVAECRKKYPMPEHEQWECFGPVATEAQIKYTREEDTVEDSMMFREDCDYRFSNGTNFEKDWRSAYPMVTMSNGATYILPTLDDLVREGTLTDEEVDYAIHCVCEAAGKATFIDDFAKEGLRTWLGVPHSIGDDDGRIMGGYLEMFLQSMHIAYDIEAFNREEVIYRIDRMGLSNRMPKMVNAYIWFWYGMTKSLVNAQWSLWEEASTEEKVRIKIAKKVDKFC